MAFGANGTVPRGSPAALPHRPRPCLGSACRLRLEGPSPQGWTSAHFNNVQVVTQRRTGKEHLCGGCFVESVSLSVQGCRVCVRVCASACVCVCPCACVCECVRTLPRLRRTVLWKFYRLFFWRQLHRVASLKQNGLCYADRSHVFLPLAGRSCDSTVFKRCGGRGCQMSWHFITSRRQSSFQNATAQSICCY